MSHWCVPSHFGDMPGEGVQTEVIPKTDPGPAEDRCQPWKPADSGAHTLPHPGDVTEEPASHPSALVGTGK